MLAGPLLESSRNPHMGMPFAIAKPMPGCSHYGDPRGPEQGPGIQLNCAPDFRRANLSANSRQTCITKIVIASSSSILQGGPAYTGTARRARSAVPPSLRPGAFTLRFYQIVLPSPPRLVLDSAKDSAKTLLSPAGLH